MLRMTLWFTDAKTAKREMMTDEPHAPTLPKTVQIYDLSGNKSFGTARFSATRRLQVKGRARL